MGYVRLKPNLNLVIADKFGGTATRPHALKVEAKAKALADAKAKHSSVAGDIDISMHAHGTHTAVVMSVTGRDGRQIASHLEFGYYNRWLERKHGEHSPLARMPGLHIMSEARYG